MIKVFVKPFFHFLSSSSRWHQTLSSPLGSPPRISCFWSSLAQLNTCFHQEASAAMLSSRHVSFASPPPLPARFGGSFPWDCSSKHCSKGGGKQQPPSAALLHHFQGCSLTACGALLHNAIKAGAWRKSTKTTDGERCCYWLLVIPGVW